MLVQVATVRDAIRDLKLSTLKLSSLKLKNKNELLS